MEFENLDFYDEKSVIDYTNKIRNEINKGLEDLRKRDTIFDTLLLEREMIINESRVAAGGFWGDAIPPIYIE